MKKLLLTVLGALLVTKALAQQEVANPKIPLSIQRTLNNKFPGWRFPNLNRDIRKAAKQSAQFPQMNLIQGDFDGNGQLDYALQIEQGNFLNERNGNSSNRLYLVAFLKKGNGYRFYLVDENGDRDYLILQKKGGRLYNFELQGNFTLKNDAFEAIIFEKAGTTYVYEKGRFLAITTGD